MRLESCENTFTLLNIFHAFLYDLGFGHKHTITLPREETFDESFETYPWIRHYSSIEIQVVYMLISAKKKQTQLCKFTMKYTSTDIMLK